jgi:hypothetical protein
MTFDPVGFHVAGFHPTSLSPHQKGFSNNFSKYEEIIIIINTHK